MSKGRKAATGKFRVSVERRGERTVALLSWLGRGCGVALGLMLLASSASAAPEATDPRIVNGLVTHDFPTTGALMYSSGGTINANNAGSWCSGTLIGCSTFLTAAHCVEDDTSPNAYWVFLQHSGVHSVVSVTPHPNYTSSNFPRDDVAVLKLGAPVTGINPTALNDVDSPAFGTTGTIAGFGRTGGSSEDYGIKRYGDVQTTDCSGQLSGVGNTELVCWQFSSPVGAPGDDSNTCNGDSGGPLFIDFGGTETVAGITSGGTSSSCLATDFSYDTNVFSYRTWIAGQLGSDSTSVCGGLPAVGTSDVQVVGFDGALSSNPSTATLPVSISGSPSVLRFAFKADDRINADFYVAQGASVSTTNFDCKAEGNGSVGICEFTSPANGDWTVLVRRVSGSGDYQITATAFGGDPPV